MWESEIKYKLQYTKNLIYEHCRNAYNQIGDSSFDLVFKTKDQEIFAHQIMFAISTDFIKEFHNNSTASLTVLLPDYSSKCVSCLIEYIYSGTTVLKDDIKDDFLQLCRELKLHNIPVILSSFSEESPEEISTTEMKLEEDESLIHEHIQDEVENEIELEEEVVEELDDEMHQIYLEQEEESNDDTKETGYEEITEEVNYEVVEIQPQTSDSNDFHSRIRKRKATDDGDETLHTSKTRIEKAIESINSGRKQFKYSFKCFAC